MSKKTQTYTQCIMHLWISETSKMIYTAWIPSQLAKVGRSLEIKIEGEWTTGWVVAEKGAVKDAAYVEEHERDYTRQREASDI